jgi:lipopolysaccharide transport system permease protein
LAIPSRRAHLHFVLHKATCLLRSEASRTYLGFLWWILDPLLLMGVYYFLFGVLVNRGAEDFVPFLLVGLVSWQWFSKSILQCGQSINKNANLLAQFKFPKVLLPSVDLTVNAIRFAMIFAVLLVFLWLYGFAPSFHYLALPLILAVQLLLTGAIGFLLAGIIPFLPDLTLVINNLLRIVFYLSGVLYSIDKVPERLQPWFYINPMVVLIEAYRAVLMYDAWPDGRRLLAVFGGSLVLTLAGLWLLRRFDNEYPRVVLQR